MKLVKIFFYLPLYLFFLTPVKAENLIKLDTLIEEVDNGIRIIFVNPKGDFLKSFYDDYKVVKSANSIKFNLPKKITIDTKWENEGIKNNLKDLSINIEENSLSINFTKEIKAKFFVSNNFFGSDIVFYKEKKTSNNKKEEPLNIAVYDRTGKIWIFFDKKKVDNLLNNEKKFLRYETKEINKGSLFFTNIKDDFSTKNLTINSKNIEDNLFISFDYIEKKELSFNNTDKSKTIISHLEENIFKQNLFIEFTDPIVGDDLIFIPSNKRVFNPQIRKYIKFDIIPSIQGVIIKKKSDDLVVTVTQKQITLE